MNKWAGFLNSFLEIDKLDKRRREYRNLGWIYVVRNPMYKDTVFKIGLSKRPPMKRAEELSRSTGVLGEFEVVYFVHVSDRKLAEKVVHSKLVDFRVSAGKEFFQAPLPRITKVLDEVAAMFAIMLGRGSRKRALEQPFGHRLIGCQSCGQSIRVKVLPVAINIRCTACGETFMLSD